MRLQLGQTPPCIRSTRPPQASHSVPSSESRKKRIFSISSTPNRGREREKEERPCKGEEKERKRKDVVFFFNDTATTEIYTLSLHDALQQHKQSFVFRSFSILAP